MKGEGAGGGREQEAGSREQGARKSKKKQEKARTGKNKQEKARKIKNRQEKARKGKKRQEKARQNKKKQEKAGQNTKQQNSNKNTLYDQCSLLPVGPHAWVHLAKEASCVCVCSLGALGCFFCTSG